MKGEQCPRCRRGQLCRFDPRDAEPSCLACGYVPYAEALDLPPPGQEPKRHWKDPAELVERKARQNREWHLRQKAKR